ncbi:unnamed protein product [Polarella glacialis]|uniref:Uncharacterized protein n=1 Tax=Polarella glacialis TaxID=89957 RepID=A0A813J0K9_POLGL|nr:unnamed protein product [Polarella glacialis]
MARSASSLAPLLCLALVAFVAVQGPAFLPAGSVRSAQTIQAVQGLEEADGLRFGAAVAAAPALLSSPLMASASEGMPAPVLGIMMLSVIVVIVLVISGLVIARGLLDDETGGEL